MPREIIIFNYECTLTLPSKFRIGQVIQRRDLQIQFIVYSYQQIFEHVLPTYTFTYKFHANLLISISYTCLWNTQTMEKQKGWEREKDMLVCYVLQWLNTAPTLQRTSGPIKELNIILSQIPAIYGMLLGLNYLHSNLKFFHFPFPMWTKLVRILKCLFIF